MTGRNLAAVDTLDQIGLGQWLRVAIGSLELHGAAGLMISLTAGLAAACLAALVVGAMGVELFVVDDGSITAPLICFVIVAVVADGDDQRAPSGARRCLRLSPRCLRLNGLDNVLACRWMRNSCLW